MFNAATASFLMNQTTNNQELLNERRRLAVKLRLQGQKIADITEAVGLSAPTIIAAHKLFLSGGWPAVDVKPRGRAKGKQQTLSAEVLAELRSAAENYPPAGSAASGKPWTLKSLEQFCIQQFDTAISARSLGKYIEQWGLSATNLHTACKDSDRQIDWLNTRYQEIVDSTRRADGSVFWVGCKSVDTKDTQSTLIYAHSTRGQYFWLADHTPNNQVIHLIEFLERLGTYTHSHIGVVLHGMDITRDKTFQTWTSQQKDIAVYPHPELPLQKSTSASGTKHDVSTDAPQTQSDNPSAPQETRQKNKRKLKSMSSLTHLQRLEAESIHIMREVVATADKPVMLYSIGKDSAVMLHLAMKAFYPAKLPFPLLHVDTGWKFQAMYEFRDKTAKDIKAELITYKNPEGVEKEVNPFTHGSALHTDIMKTQGLKQALDKYGFDVAFGGARRDEEQSRAKERIFSFRNEQHRWDPKNQRPELWSLYNTNKMKGESIRAFPISNWTELDVWQYIYKEGIPIVPLYYAAQRPVVMRDGKLIMVDDDRMPMNPGEVPMIKNIRFRTLGCYPLTGAIESSADTLPDIIQEMLLTNTSERQGRMIDQDSNASMEKKKQEGYF